jgi:integrase
MSTRHPLTEARMKAWADTPAEKETRLYDSTVPQLVARRRPGGKPRWYLLARANGKARQVPLGDLNTWPEVPVSAARDLARRALVDLAGAVDPVQERADRREKAAQVRRGGLVPLADATRLHLAKVRERKRDERHSAEIERVMALAVEAGVVDLASPGALASAREWLDDLDVSPVTRNRYRVHLLAVTKTALANYPAEALPRDPFLALRGQGAPLPEPASFTPYEAMRLVSDEALAMDGGALFAFLLYTGARYKEGAFARWDRINLGRSTYDVIPPNALERAAGFRVKRDKPRTIHLPGELVAVLKAMEPHADGPWLVKSGKWRTRMQWDNVADFREHLSRLGIPLADAEGRGRKIHSLRHTRQTLGLACGEDSLRLRLSMGHAGEEMSAHYARMAMRWRGLLSGWAGELRLRDPGEVARITGEAGKVVAS